MSIAKEANRDERGRESCRHFTGWKHAGNVVRCRASLRCRGNRETEARALPRRALNLHASSHGFHQVLDDG